MDLKSPAGKTRFRELLMDADVVVNNLLAGTMDKLEFGLKDVLEIIKGRGKGIVYAESVSFDRNQVFPFGTLLPKI
jgi:crotonobetainyl-CoA:carnitine CoA-transferase CaiB-like acyl-CoA transferase